MEAEELELGRQVRSTPGTDVLAYLEEGAPGTSFEATDLPRQVTAQVGGRYLSTKVCTSVPGPVFCDFDFTHNSIYSGISNLPSHSYNIRLYNSTLLGFLLTNNSSTSTTTYTPLRPQPFS